jgi:pyrroline-5-carboxylate reductase
MKIAVIGCGAMGSAFAKHFAQKHTLLLCDRDENKGESLAAELGGSYFKKPSEAAALADVVLLAVKPKDLPMIADEIAPALTKGKILMSILAGTLVATLKQHFPSASIVRTMPNLGLMCGAGVMGLADTEDLTPETKQSINKLIEGMGLNLWMKENKIEAITALSGSGIGFVLVLIEAMIDGGVHLGFTAGEAREIVLKTMEGAIALMRETGKHPAELKLQISSPGGTTIAGLKVMEEAGVRSGIMKAMVACYEKALSMQ